MLTLYIDSDNLVEVTGLKDASSGDYINTADVAWSLKRHPSGTEVASGSMDYVTGTDGNYRGTIENTATLMEGQRYWLDVTVSGSGVPDGFSRDKCIAKYKEAAEEGDCCG